MEIKNSDIDFYKKFLLKNCRKISNFYLKNKIFFYRGEQNRSDIFVLKSGDKTRKPMNLSDDLQNLFDEILEKNNYGVLRKKGLFCTSDIRVAKFYAKKYPDSLYIVFPTDDFKFLYSTKIKDMFEYYDFLFPEIKKEIFNYSNFWGFRLRKRNKTYGSFYVVSPYKRKYFLLSLKNLIKEYYKKSVEFDNVMELQIKFFNIFDLSTHENDDFVEKLNEIIIQTCEEYDNRMDDEKYFLNKSYFRFYFEKFILENYKNDDLVLAAKSKNEVIFNASAYLQISLSFIDDFEKFENFIN